MAYVLEAGGRLFVWSAHFDMTTADQDEPEAAQPVLVTASVPATTLGLAETFRACPSLTVVRARYAVTDSTALFPLVWTEVDDPSRLRSALAGDPSVRSTQRLLAANERTLWRVHWDPSVEGVSSVFSGAETILLSGVGSAQQWHLELLFPSRTTLARVCDRCESRGVPHSIDRIRDLETNDSRVMESTRLGLTAEQYTALTTAYELGYFTVPRAATLDEVAEALDVSHQALSERLRRAQQTVLEAWVNTPGGGLGREPTHTGSSDE